MSNSAGTQSSREEEIAFLAMEDVLGVEIHLADAGAGDKQPDGAWEYSNGCRGIVEITSPPATELMREWAAAKRDGRPQSESGTTDTRFGELAEVCTEMLAADWAQDNIEKLMTQPADERHLFLFARSYDVGHYFYRLTDSYEDAPPEQIEDLMLPDGISDVWFRGRASRVRGQTLGPWNLWLARFQAGVGWHRYVVSIEEQHLPSPNPGLADDIKVPAGWRRPKGRRNPFAGA